MRYEISERSNGNYFVIDTFIISDRNVLCSCLSEKAAIYIRDSLNFIYKMKMKHNQSDMPKRRNECQ